LRERLIRLLEYISTEAPAHAGGVDGLLQELVAWVGSQRGPQNEPQVSLRVSSSEHDSAESLIATAPAAVLLIDSNGLILRFNPFLEDLSGWSLHEVLGQNWFDTFVPERDRPRVRQSFLGVLTEGRTSAITARLVTRDGRERQVKWSITSLQGSYSEVTGLLSVGQDVTECKEAQQQQLQSARLAAIGETVTALAHESGNALQRIQAYAEMLAPEVVDRPRARSLLAGIQEAGADLGRLQQEVLDYAAPGRLERRVCDLADVVQSAWQHLAHRWIERKVQLRVGPSDLKLWADADPFRLEQVYRNLFGNALDACPDPVEITVTWAEEVLDNRPSLRCTLRDNGPGIPPGCADTVFRPFFTTKPRGTGLGLAIARRLVELHGGQLTVVSNLGRGAEFVVLIPRRRP
jgi:PAS domain S-box-containing protein